MTVAELIERLKTMPQELTVLFNTCEGPIPFTNHPQIAEAYHRGKPDEYYGWSIDYFAEDMTAEDKAADDADYGHVRQKVVTL